MGGLAGFESLNPWIEALETSQAPERRILRVTATLEGSQTTRSRSVPVKRSWALMAFRL